MSDLGNWHTGQSGKHTKYLNTGPESAATPMAENRLWFKHYHRHIQILPSSHFKEMRLKSSPQERTYDVNWMVSARTMPGFFLTVLTHIQSLSIYRKGHWYKKVHSSLDQRRHHCGYENVSSVKEYEKNLQCLPSLKGAFRWAEDRKRAGKECIFIKKNEYISEFMVC